MTNRHKRCAGHGGLWPRAALALTLVLAVAGASCQPSGTTSPVTPSADAQTTTASPRKVLLIVEENKSYDEVIGNGQAPYLNRLAHTYGLATAYDSGYPLHCPSLAAYLILTSGTTHGICDDEDATRHRVTGPNLFQQVAASGRQWRGYAESMPDRCVRENHGRYVPRHLPAPYYVTETARCRNWDLPMGTRTSGALHDDLAAGRLPALSMVTPDNCHDMHGGLGCVGDRVGTGDRWLAGMVPAILDSADYRAGRLTVVVTWDEGTNTANHVLALVISPTSRAVKTSKSFTHFSLLRTAEEILRLRLLGCAATAPSMRRTFRL